MIYIYIAIFAFFICLFIQYVLAKHDFVLARKGILLQSFFNCIFSAFAFAFVGGRIFYIINTQRFELLSWIVFLHLIKFPGFSILGGIIFLALGLAFLIKDRSVWAKAFDIIFVSFYLFFVFLNFPFLKLSFFFKAIFLISNLGILVFFLFSYKNYLLKDATAFFLVLAIFSGFDFWIEFLLPFKKIFFYFSFLQIMDMLIFLIAVLFVLVNEKLVRRN